MGDNAYRKGLSLYLGDGVQKDFWEAVRLFKIAAEEDHVGAQVCLGHCYMYGDETCDYEGDAFEATKWYELAAKRGSSEGRLSLGDFAQELSYYRKAIEWYKLAAKQGNDIAQFRLGYIYENGGGREGSFVKKNFRDAVFWYELAAKQGHKMAQFNLGNCYANGRGVKRNDQEAFRWWLLAAEQRNTDDQWLIGQHPLYNYVYRIGKGVDKKEKEDTDAAAVQFLVATCYYNGTGVEKNDKKALNWYQLAANQDLAEAQHALGEFYEKGVVVEKNLGEAARFYHIAARKGDVNAEVALAKCYWEGKGVVQSNQEALNWFRNAAGKGNAAAQLHLGVFCSNVEGVEQNYEEAVRWWRLSAEQNNGLAQKYLADCYKNGEIVQRDYQEALRLYRLAADQGVVEAQFNLGLCYEEGTGVKRMSKTAVHWYRKAAGKGCAEAQYRLGLCFKTGHGVGKNRKEAASWFQRAAALGHVDSKLCLGDYVKPHGGNTQKDQENESNVKSTHNVSASTDQVQGQAVKPKDQVEPSAGECVKPRDVTKDKRSHQSTLAEKIRTVDDFGDLGKSTEFDTALFEKWSEDQALQDFSRHESVVNDFISQMSDNTLDRGAMMALAKQRDEAVQSCLASAKQLIARQETIKPVIEEFCRLRSRVISDRKSKKSSKKIDIDSFLNLRQECQAKRISLYRRLVKTESDVEQLLTVLSSKKTIEDKCSTIRDAGQQAAAAHTTMEKDLFILEEKHIEIINLMRPLCDTHYSTHVRVFIDTVDRARRRLPELEVRSVGAPSLELLSDCQKSEKKAQKKYKRAKLDLELPDSDSEDETSLSHEQKQQNLAKALAKWRQAARKLERVTTEFLNLASSLFPELVHESQTIRDNIGSGIQSARAREHYEDLAQLPGRHSVSKVRIDDRVCVLKAYHLDNEHSRRAFRKEVKFLSQLTHPHVVKLTAAFIESNTGYVEMPFCEYGDLWQWKKAIDPDANLLKLVFRSALLGLSFVHSMDVVHSDVKPGNIFVDSSHCAKIGDFDVSKDDSDRVRDLMTTAVVPTSVGYTVSYVAPELLNGGSNAKPTKSSDVYAFGLSMFDIYFSNAPGQSKRPPASEIANGRKVIRFPDDAEEELKQTLTVVLNKNPNERPSCSDALVQLAYFSLSKESSAESDIVQNCLICDKATVISNGIVCPSQQQHFQCDECLAGYFSAFTSADDGVQLLVPDGSGVKCPFPTNEEHDCTPYDDAQLARMLPADVFQQSMKVRGRHMEQRLSVEYEVRLQQELREREAQGEVQRHRQYIIERILNLACPRCSLAFYEFTACFAIKCTRCQCGFCAWCFQDCGKDAHTHVRHCRRGNGGLSGTRKQFDESNRVRRQQKVRSYLAKEIPNKDLRKQVQQACKKEFHDLNLQIY